MIQILAYVSFGLVLGSIILFVIGFRKDDDFCKLAAIGTSCIACICLFAAALLV